MKPQDMTNEQLAAELLEPLPHTWAIKEAARRLTVPKSTTVPIKGWSLRLSRERGLPFLAGAFFWTRSDAINDYNRAFLEPNAYRRGRRAGKVRAVRVAIAEDTQLKEPNK